VALLASDLGKRLLDGSVRETLLPERIEMLQNLVLRGFEHAIETPQHDHGEHDAAILRWAVRTAKLVGDGPDFFREFLVLLSKHLVRTRLWKYRQWLSS